MASELYELLKEYKKENLINWCKEAIYFFKSPRKFIQITSQRSINDLVPQYFFYFIIYTLSYIFISLGFSVNELIKPATLNLVNTVPVLLTFSLSAKIACGKFYLKKISIFFLSINLFLAPILLVLFALFLNAESYIYKLFFNSLSALFILFMLFGYGFVIEFRFGKALRIILWNYLVVNIIWLGLIRSNFDEYGGITPTTKLDPIFDEYTTAVNPLEFKEVVPNIRVLAVIDDKISIIFGVQNLMSDTASIGGNSTNDLYKAEIEKNIEQLNAELEKVKFKEIDLH